MATSIVATSILIFLTWKKSYGIRKMLSQLNIETPLHDLLILDGT